MLLGSRPVRARLLGRLRRARRAVRRARRLAVRLHAARSASCSASLTILLGLAFVGLRAVAPARRARPPGARRSGSRRRRCSACCSASAGRPASGRPWPPSRRWRCNEGTAGRGALLGVRLLPRARHAVHRRRRWPSAGCSARSRWVRRHQVWVTRLGGADAGRWSALLLVTGCVGPWSSTCAAGRPRASTVGGLMTATTDAHASAGAEWPRAAAGRRPPPSTPPALSPRGARRAGPGASSPRCAPRWCCCSCSRSAAIPGSVDPAAATSTRSRSRTGRPRTRTLTPIYEKLGLFDVYGSPWFAAIYLLLMVSLVGCIVPRLRVYWRGAPGPAAARAAQPRPAARTTRRTRTDEEPDAVLERARAGAARAALPGASTGDGRRGRRGARLPARGRQPALPPLGAGRAGRLRDRAAVRLQGRRDPGRRQRVLQHPEPVRRLRARRAVQAPTTWSRSASPSTTST